MTIDLHTIVIAILGVACGIMGWLGRELWGAVKDLRSDLSKLEVRITREYVSYDRLKDALTPVLDGIKEIKDALHNKADKP